MTRMYMQIDDEKNIFFSIDDHADATDVCIMCSTLTNVLLVACEKEHIEPTEENDAHVRIDITEASDTLIAVFKAVRSVFYEIEDQFPFNLKIY